jgi:hypothetical protein
MLSISNIEKERKDVYHPETIRDIYSRGGDSPGYQGEQETICDPVRGEHGPGGARKSACWTLI